MNRNNVPIGEICNARDGAADRLHEARTRFAEVTMERYASGARLAARDADRLERIAQRIVAIVDELEIDFDRLDAARDLCAYQGPNGLRIERSHWARAQVADLIAVAFEPVLHSTACAVLSAAVRSQTNSARR